MKKLVIAMMATAAFASTSAVAGDAQAGANKVAACVGCHGVGGNSTVPTFPKLAGQHAMYTDKQLKAFRSGKRADPTMAPFATSLSDADIADISAYYAAQ